MRSSLRIAASAAALLCFGQTAGAQSAKQDDKGGASSGAIQRGESSRGGSAKRDGAPDERKSSASKSSGSSSVGEGGRGSGRASSNAGSDKSSPAEKSKSGRQDADSGQAAGGAGREQGNKAERSTERSKDRDRSKGAEKADKSKDDSKRGGKAATDDNTSAEKGKAAARTPDGMKSKADRADKAGEAGEGSAKSATRDAGHSDRDKSERGGGASTGAATGTGGMQRDQKGSAAQDRRGEDRVRISARQRTTVHDRVLKSKNVNRVEKVDVSINVGVRIPRTVRLARLPPDVIEIVPQFRSYEYFVSDDRICIVEPSTYEIVEVIESGGPRAAAVRSGGLSLTAEEREIVLRTVDPRDGARGLPIPREGAGIPDRVEVHAFPHATLREVPKLERYRYFAAEASIVIVDPRDERVELVVGDR